MVQVQTIYTQVCNTLLEPGGLQLGLVTLQEFLDYCYNVIQDFLQQAGLYKKIACIQAPAGSNTLNTPSWLLDTQALYWNETALSPGTQGDWDLTFPGWRRMPPTYPQYWAEDRLNPKQFVPIPAPAINGNSVNVLTGQGFPTTNPDGGFYGTFGAVTGTLPASDITIAASAPFYGTISSFTGDVYTETAGPFFGTVAFASASPTNYADIGTAGVFANNLTLNSPIEGMPDSFTVYITYGVLAKIFSKDGEQKDDQRAAYAQTRYAEGVALAKMISRQGGQIAH